MRRYEVAFRNVASHVSMNKAIVIFVLATILNFAAFGAGTCIVGGDAVTGTSMCPPGNYLWDKRLPQPCHEVSESIYRYSKFHAYSVFISWPIAIIAGIYLNGGIKSTLSKWRRRGGAA